MPDTPIDSCTVDTEGTIISICAFHDCHEQNVKRCRKCNRPFCIMHCNTYSPNFCKECFSNISIVAEKFKRVFDHVADNGQLYTKVEEKIKYYLDGPDWPFVTPWIDSLSDEELKILWVFHHHIMKAIEHENDTRNVERNRVLRNQPTPRLITGSVTKTRSVTKVQQPETPETMRAKWTKQGIPNNIIDMMIAAMVK